MVIIGKNYEAISILNNGIDTLKTPLIMMMVRFGKTGTKGQENVKVFENEEQANTEIEKLIKQKAKKGYKG